MSSVTPDRWYIRLETLPDRAASLLASQLIWLGESTLVTRVGSTLWVQTCGSATAILPLLRRLPGVIYREVDGELFRLGANVPEMDTKSLHDLKQQTIQWLPLADVCRVEVPVPQVAPHRPEDRRQGVRLIRGGVMTDCHALLTRVDVLRAWIETASQARIERLRWAIRKQDCLLMGEPLPPIEGQYFVLRDRVIVPAGMTWTPLVAAEMLVKLFGVSDHDWLLWESSNRWSAIPEDAFVAMTRASVRVADEPTLWSDYSKESAGL